MKEFKIKLEKNWDVDYKLIGGSENDSLGTVDMYIHANPELDIELDIIQFNSYKYDEVLCYNVSINVNGRYLSTAYNIKKILKTIQKEGKRSETTEVRLQEYVY